LSFAVQSIILPCTRRRTCNGQVENRHYKFRDRALRADTLLLVEEQRTKKHALCVRQVTVVVTGHYWEYILRQTGFRNGKAPVISEWTRQLHCILYTAMAEEKDCW